MPPNAFIRSSRRLAIQVHALPYRQPSARAAMSARQRLGRVLQRLALRLRSGWLLDTH